MKSMCYILMMGVLLIGCTIKSPQASINPPVMMTASDWLGEWQIQTPSLTGRDGMPLRLSVGRSIALINGCNHVWADYRAEGGRLVVNDVYSTRMACQPNLMQADSLVAALLKSGLSMQYQEGGWILTAMLANRPYTFVRLPSAN